MGAEVGWGVKAGAEIVEGKVTGFAKVEPVWH